jgi:hypothetical protein
LRISRLRAGLALTFAAVSLMVGAQAAEACTEPALGDLPARGQEKELVAFEVTGVTPGSEYLVKVNGRERKAGVTDADKIARHFRMPSFGDSRRRVKVEVVLANDACENSPWKLKEKMTYMPAPQPEAPAQQPQPQPTPNQSPAPNPTPNPAPAPPAPSPPSPPSANNPGPAPTPPVPAPSIKSPPAVKTPPPIKEPPRDGKTWLTPLDPFQKQVNAPLKLNAASLGGERPSEVANSTAALIGLGGVFLLLLGSGAMAWNRFRRYDDEKLTEIENPDGKLPTHLDPNAPDVQTAGAVVFQAKLSRKEKKKLSEEELDAYLKRRRATLKQIGKNKRTKVLPAFDPTAGLSPAAAAAAMANQWKEKPEEEAPKKKRLRIVRRRKTAPAAAAPVASEAATEVTSRAEAAKALDGESVDHQPRLSRKEKKKLSEEEMAAYLTRRRATLKRASKNKRKNVLPTFDPTATGAAAPAGEQKKDDEVPKKKRFARLRRKDAVPTADQPAPDAGPATNGKPAHGVVPPIPAPNVNGAAHANGAPAEPITPPAKQATPPPPTPPKRPPAQRSYREEVESELQRILADAGLSAEVDGILADAKKEAERQGIPIDSELMLKALCEETNGSAKLSDSARGELESRFKRIVAEERGESGPRG